MGNFKRFAVAACVAAFAVTIGCAPRQDVATQDSQAAQSEQAAQPSPIESQGSVKLNPPDKYENIIESHSYNAESSGESVAKLDTRAYYGGGAPAYVVSQKILNSSEGGSSSFKTGMPIPSFKDDVKVVHIGGKDYSLGDIVTSGSSGIGVLELFAKDFGVVRYARGDDGMAKAEKLGAVTGDDLLGAYSEAGDKGDYKIYTYFFDAPMSALSDDEAKLARTEFESLDSQEPSLSPDGLLSVTLFCNSAGDCVYYTVSVTPPGHYEDAADYAANKGAGVSYDVTNCYIEMSDGTPVGLGDFVTIICK